MKEAEQGWQRAMDKIVERGSSDQSCWQRAPWCFDIREGLILAFAELGLGGMSDVTPKADVRRVCSRAR